MSAGPPESLALAGVALVCVVAAFGFGFFLGWFLRGITHDGTPPPGKGGGA